METNLIEVKQLNATTYDVFHDKGWDHRSRWVVDNKGFLTFVEGEYPPKEVKEEIIRQLGKKQKWHKE